jgi:hypothetical protein
MKFLEDYPSTSGEHKINVTKKAEYFCNAMEKYYSSHEVLFKKFYYLGKKLSSDLMEVSKTLCAISLCSQHISVLYEIGSSKSIAQVYQDMSEHFKKWGKEVHNEAKVNLQHLPQFFNYSSLENLSYKDMFAKRQYLQNKFVTKSNDLYAKKEKLFKSGRTDRWELSEEDLKRASELSHLKEDAFEAMLPKESKIAYDYEQSYMYLTTR